jgi:hypothetical protein
MLIFLRGGWLYEDPCDASVTLRRGRANGRRLRWSLRITRCNATAPVDVTLGGYVAVRRRQRQPTRLSAPANTALIPESMPRP